VKAGGAKLRTYGVSDAMAAGPPNLRTRAFPHARLPLSCSAA